MSPAGDSEQIARLERMYEGIDDKSHYDVMGLQPNVKPEAIRLAFHGLTREFHPDRFHAAKGSAEFRKKVERVYARILEAYRVLSNEAQRRSYHEQLGLPPPGYVAGAGATLGTTFQVGQPAVVEEAKAQVRPGSRRVARLKSKLAERIRESRAKVTEGKNHFDAGRWEEAARCFQDALAIDPRNKDAETYMKRARQKGRNMKAEEAFQQGRREESRNPERALACFRAAVRQRPSVGRYHHYLAAYLREQNGEPHEVVELLREAIELEPNNPDYHAELARTLQAQGVRGAARAEWAKVLQLDPNHREAKTAFRRLK